MRTLMQQREEQFINVILVGNIHKCLNFFNYVQKFAKKYKDTETSLGIFDDKFNLGISIFNQKIFSEGHAVVYINANEVQKNFVENLDCRNQFITIEYNNNRLTALECLYGIESLYNQIIEKSVLVLAGNKDMESYFSFLPSDVAKEISSMQYEVSSKYSASSFFKAISPIPQISTVKTEAKQKKRASKCLIQ